MGKTKLIEWLLYRLNAHGGSEAGNLAFKIDLSKLEQVWMNSNPGKP
jgi:hypothetical protein